MYFSQNKIKTIIEIAKIPKFSNLKFMRKFFVFSIKCLAMNIATSKRYQDAIYA